MKWVIFLNQRFNNLARRRAVDAILAANVCPRGVNVPAYLIQNGAAARFQKMAVVVPSIILARGGDKKLSARRKIA